MDKKGLLQAIKKIKTDSPKRKFNQSVDLIVNLKDLNPKNPDDQVDFFVTLSNSIGIKRSVCALVGPELRDEAKKVCDQVVSQEEFGSLKKVRC